MTVEPAPDGNGEQKSKWEELGFDSEQSMLDAAKAANDLRSKITEAEATLKKEREAKSKTDTDYMRQAQEIGDLRKKLEKLEKPPEQQPDKDDAKDDELLESLSSEEATVLDGVLNDPKNVELKKRVALGGNKAMAEFVKAFRAEAPTDLSVSLFSTLKKKKTDTVQRDSIAKAVKDLFAKHSEEEKNNLAATGVGGTSPQQRAKTTGQRTVYGGVNADYYRAKT